MHPVASFSHLCSLECSQLKKKVWWCVPWCVAVRPRCLYPVASFSHLCSLEYSQSIRIHRGGLTASKETLARSPIERSIDLSARSQGTHKRTHETRRNKSVRNERNSGESSRPKIGSTPDPAIAATPPSTLHPSARATRNPSLKFTSSVHIKGTDTNHRNVSKWVFQQKQGRYFVHRNRQPTETWSPKKQRKYPEWHHQVTTTSYHRLPPTHTVSLPGRCNF